MNPEEYRLKGMGRREKGKMSVHHVGYRKEGEGVGRRGYNMNERANKA